MEQIKDENQIRESEHKKAVADYFSSRNHYWDVVYDENKSGNSYLSFHMRKRREKVLDFVDQYAKGHSLNVLDVGCGTGAFLEELFKRNHNSFGIDISRKMISDTQKRISEKYKKNSVAVCTDVESLPFCNNYFDLIICIGVLEYLPNDFKTITELMRIVKPEGNIIFTLPNKYKLRNVLDPYYYLIRGWKYFFSKIASKNKVIKADLNTFSKNEVFINRRYSYKQIKNIISRSGLNLITIYSLGYGPLTIWRKQFLPLKSTIGFSERMESFANNNGGNFLRNYPNRWIVCTTRK